VLQVYHHAGFNVRTILMDGEFKKIKDLMPLVVCNTTAAKEHVSKAEQTICTIKEQVGGLLGTLPFSHIPQWMKIEFIYFMVLWLNAFPVKNGISAVHSPRELLVCWRLDYNKHCRVLPRTYCEVHNEPLPSNTMMPRTHETIAVGPTGNLQGSMKFHSLDTGRIIKQRSFTPLPMPDWVIEHVNVIGLRKRQGRTFCFLNQKLAPFEWTDSVPEDDDKFQGLLEEEEAAVPDISAELPGVELKAEEAAFQTVEDEPDPLFEDLAMAALDNAGINPHKQLQSACMADKNRQANMAPAMIEPEQDEIVYKITFDLPDAGLQVGIPYEVDEVPVSAAAVPAAPVQDDAWQYPIQLRRSVIGNQPYDSYAPRMQFLQLREVQAHRSVIDAARNIGNNKQEWIHATMSSKTMVDDAEQAIIPELMTESEDEMKVWGYLMTQYNLKPGL
jgi:hypothetical protein